MALTLHISRVQQLVGTFHACRRFSVGKMMAATLSPTQFDIIDAFTSHLVHRELQKAVREKNTKPQYSMCSLVKSERKSDINLAQLTQDDLDKESFRLIDEFETDQVEEFLSKCLNDKVCPSFQSVLLLLDANSRNAKPSFEIVAHSKHLLQSQPKTSQLVELFQTNASFEHYEAEAYWLNGEIIKSVRMFTEVYEKHPNLRRRIKLMLKRLIADVTRQGEAVLVSVVNFSEELYRRHNEAYALVCLWQACFLSDCYIDQKFSFQLIEDNADLCERIEAKMPYVIAMSLREHRVEIVYQLLELMLRKQRKQQYGGILIALFDYKCTQGDLKSCSEILQWSSLHNVTLPQMLCTRFLMSLLGDKDYDGIKWPDRTQSKISFKF